MITRGLQFCLLGFWPLSQNPAGAMIQPIRVKWKAKNFTFIQKLRKLIHDNFTFADTLADTLMAADGRANSSSANFSEENGSFIFLSQFDTRHLKANKSKLIWSGSFEELFDFTEKYLNVNREMAKLSVNDSKKTIKADHLILNLYETTGTLQLQGPQATDYKAFLNRGLLDAEIQSESHNSRYSDDAITADLKETEAVSPDHLIKGQFPAEVVSTPIFLKELEKIWTELNLFIIDLLRSITPTKVI